MTATISTISDASEPRFAGHVWTSESGTHAAVELGGPAYLTFHDPATARQLAAACAAAADAMDAEIARTGKAASDA